MSVIISHASGKTPVVRVHLSGDSVRELRTVLNRAMNTWEPGNYPDWLQDLSDVVDEELNDSGEQP